MDHYPATPATALLPELRAELTRVRAQRAFDPAWYLHEKVEMLASYFRASRLDAAVLGLSGGVDSAVVLGILRAAKEAYPEVFRRIVPLVLPVNRDAVGQASAGMRAVSLCAKWEIPVKVGNLYESHLELKAAVEEAIGDCATPWASGQLVSYIRTPALYFATSLLKDQGFNAVVVGTTNRDEGAYLGYVGKASDGMVDIQLIADLHKSEVYALARHLGVSEEILDAVPSGEMFDGRVDEEVFGAPYDFVELFLAHKWDLTGLITWSNGLSPEADDQYSALAANLEALHDYNRHKYAVVSPAVHLNVLPSAVPGGWKQ